MIMIWNRREVFLGNSMKKFGGVRDILASNHIKYDYRVINRNSSSGRARTGTFGQNMDYSNEYYVYVHKNDYELACEILHID